MSDLPNSGTMPSGYRRVMEMLQAGGKAYTLHQHMPIRTIEEAHAKVPHLTRNLLKTVVFKIKGGDWILAAVNGSDRIHYKRLADAFGVKRTDLRSIAPEQVETQLGFEVGGVGPFPVRPDIRIVFDARLDAMDTVFCGSGKNTCTVQIAMSDLAALTAGKIYPIVKESNGIPVLFESIIFLYAMTDLSLFETSP